MKYILLLFLTWQTLSVPGFAFEDKAKNSVVYKLAAVHIRSLARGDAILNSAPTPDDATLAEFKWLMDSLRNRCVDPEDDIAATILSAWRLVKNRGYPMSLLEVTRALTTNALNKNLFGNQKVRFQETSGYWTSHYKPEKK